jgi:hypothetical protein
MLEGNGRERNGQKGDRKNVASRFRVKAPNETDAGGN